MATIIYVDGKKKSVTPKNKKKFSFEEFYRIIKTDIVEFAPTKDGGVLVCDEEGKSKGKPVNEEATVMYIYGNYSPIVGDVIYIPKGELLTIKD